MRADRSGNGKAEAMETEIVIGVDGGGTRTTAVAATPDGRLLAVESGGGLNYNSIGLDAARENLRDVAERLLRACGAERYRFLSAGLAALDDAADAETLRRFAGGVFPPERLILHSDANAALYAATLGASGLVVICGTGSMVQWLDEAGRVRVGGGWGWRLGDAGSAYTLATEALRAATDAWDGAGDAGALGDAALDFFGVRDPRRLIDKIYAPGMDVARLAQFSRRVIACAASGDPAALAIVSSNMERLAAIVVGAGGAAMPATVWLHGGIFENHPFVRDLFQGALRRHVLPAGVRMVPRSPAVGALVHGFCVRGELTDEIQRNIESSEAEVRT